MLDYVRDVAAVLFLEECLGVLREEYLYSVLEGNSTAPEYWTSGEELIMEDLRRKFYNSNVRQMVKSGDVDDIDNEQDFNERSQKAMEFAVLMTHRKLVSIPYIGHPEFSEE